MNPILPHKHSAFMSERLEPLALLLVENRRGSARPLRELLADALAANEVMLHVATNLADARAALARLEFSCVLIDFVEADGIGIAQIEALRALDPQVAIVLLTASDEDELVQSAFRLGVPDYAVHGRYDGPLLLRRVRAAVRRRRQLLPLHAADADSFHRAGHDPLTGLVNRQLLADRAGQALAQSARTQRELTLVTIDVDGFHAGRDEDDRPIREALLKRVAKTLGDAVRESDTIAYVGGSRFVAVLVPADERFDAATVAYRFHARLRAIDSVENCPLNLLVSIGVAVYPRHGETVSTLLESSEQAMAQARRSGGGVVLGAALPAMPSAAPTVLIAAEVPVPYFQPWLDTRLERYAGVGLLPSPQHAAALARASSDEQRSAALALIHAACVQWRHWRNAGLALPALALSLDATLLADTELLAFLHAQIAGAALNPAEVQLEIPASVFADGTPETLARLCQFRECGFRVILNDFLSGGDGLLALAAMPLDGIKLGRAVLATLTPAAPDGGARRVVAAALGAAQGLELAVTAGGVETLAQRQLLQRLGCRYLQGNLLCEPLPADALSERWRAGPPTDIVR